MISSEMTVWLFQMMTRLKMLVICHPQKVASCLYRTGEQLEARNITQDPSNTAIWRALPDWICRGISSFILFLHKILQIQLSDELCQAGTRNNSMVRSDDPSHHERTLLPWSYISPPLVQNASHFSCFMSSYI